MDKLIVNHLLGVVVTLGGGMRGCHTGRAVADDLTSLHSTKTNDT